MFLELGLSWPVKIIKLDPHLPHKGENIGEEEGEPADKEDDENDDKSLGSIDVVSQRLIPGDIIVHWDLYFYHILKTCLSMCGDTL